MCSDRRLGVNYPQYSQQRVATAAESGSLSSLKLEKSDAYLCRRISKVRRHLYVFACQGPGGACRHGSFKPMLTMSTARPSHGPFASTWRWRGDFGGRGSQSSPAQIMWVSGLRPSLQPQGSSSPAAPAWYICSMSFFKRPQSESLISARDPAAVPHRTCLHVLSASVSQVARATPS